MSTDFYKPCKHCGKEFVTTCPNKLSCTSFCRMVFKTKEKNEKWAGKEYREPELKNGDKIAYSFFKKGRTSPCPNLKVFRG